MEKQTGDKKCCGEKERKLTIVNKIICFEGASGIGKTTLSRLFSDKYNIVPEVNQLFKREETASKYWYYEQQIKRYKLCQQSNNVSILDGDIFQPIWYNWIYDYPPEFVSKEETHAFFKTKIEEGAIAFPDKYIVFYIDENELRRRKESDKTRRRRNFEKHLKFIQPQLEYYRYLEQNIVLDVHFIEFTDIDKTREKVVHLIDNLTNKKRNDAQVFKKIVDWINLRG